MDARPSSPIVDALNRFDAGWLFLIAGAAMVASGLLIAAADDLDEARFHRNRVLAVQRQNNERIENHAAFLAALEEGDESVVRSLAGVHLRVTTEGREPLEVGGLAHRQDVSVFGYLEPEPIRLLERRRRSNTILARLALGERSRLWLMSGGVLAIFIGLLPPATRGERTERARGRPLWLRRGRAGGTG